MFARLLLSLTLASTPIALRPAPLAAPIEYSQGWQTLGTSLGIFSGLLLGGAIMAPLGEAIVFGLAGAAFGGGVAGRALGHAAGADQASPDLPLPQEVADERSLSQLLIIVMAVLDASMVALGFVHLASLVGERRGAVRAGVGLFSSDPVLSDSLSSGGST